MSFPLDEIIWRIIQEQFSRLLLIKFLANIYPRLQIEVFSYHRYLTELHNIIIPLLPCSAVIRSQRIRSQGDPRHLRYSGDRLFLFLTCVNITIAKIFKVPDNYSKYPPMNHFVGVTHRFPAFWFINSQLNNTVSVYVTIG